MFEEIINQIFDRILQHLMITLLACLLYLSFDMRSINYIVMILIRFKYNSQVNQFVE